MARRLYVGNLSFNTNEQTLTDEFSQFGTIRQVKIITDRETGHSKGFGFVEYGSDTEGDNAIQAMNGQKIDGRALKVNEAEERKPR